MDEGYIVQFKNKNYGENKFDDPDPCIISRQNYCSAAAVAPEIISMSSVVILA